MEMCIEKNCTGENRMGEICIKRVKSRCRIRNRNGTGSITVFLALILSLMLSLVCTSIESEN